MNMKSTSARVYFEGLGRSAFARGLPLNDRRNTRLSWPMFARSAWSRGESVEDDSEILWTPPKDLRLAPATDQPWIAVQDSGSFVIDAGLIIERHHSGEKYRVTGIAEGYVLEGAV